MFRASTPAERADDAESWGSFMAKPQQPPKPKQTLTHLSDLPNSTHETRQGAHIAEDTTNWEVPPELAHHPRYKVLGLLGKGGMGAVYLAEHTKMDRRVALKVIAPGLLCNSVIVKRFHQEVKAAARLSHPNIVTAFDADEAGNDKNKLHFLVMEYVEGCNLLQWSKKNHPLSVGEVCECGRQVALGLQHAFEQGMVHRDIKPHNLLRTERGQVKILDFGLARLSSRPNEGEERLTAMGMLMGTVDYMAPEQAADSGNADSRADIYSLGCTLFHLLTGEVPFPNGSLFDKIVMHANDKRPRLSLHRKDIPPQLEKVLSKMMAPKPEARYQTPAEVVDALAPFATAIAGTSSSITSPLSTAPHMPRPSRNWLRLTNLLLVLTVATLALLIQPWKQAEQNFTEADGLSEQQPKLAKIDREATPEIPNSKPNPKPKPNSAPPTKPATSVPAPTPGPSANPVKKPEPPVRVTFRTRHNVDWKSLQSWVVGQAKENYFPSYISLAAQDGPPRFCAIAVHDGKPHPFHFIVEDGSSIRPRKPPVGLRDQGMRRPYVVRFHDLFPTMMQVWDGESATTQIGQCLLERWNERLGEVRLQGNRMYCVDGNGLSLRGERNFFYTAVPARSKQWDARVDLTDAELAKTLETLQKRFWRPEWISVYSNDKKEVRYLLTMIADPVGPKWNYQLKLSATQLEKRLQEEQKRGYRPLAILQRGPALAPTYAVVWISDAAPIIMAR